ncbi:MAG: UDP-N-acetylmuramoyl-L-alanine--D-glutamate ligase [Clostridia bacterium]|nr:UDP-N-acetylmuramoyl-L-alanine--D-glutamate ligase [Clostridia bacterium]
MKDKKILVIGMGRSGKAAVEALVGAGASVSVQDSKADGGIDAEFAQYLKDNGIKTYFGEKPEDVLQYDMLVLSPGVPPAVDFIREAAEAGAEIIGELELAYRLCKGSFVAITGTNGKTTTTTLVGEIYKASGRDTIVGGNIGRAIAVDAQEAGEDTWMITETSSFQLETIKDFRPEVSAILNLTPDHMDRHKTMENYGRAKAAVFMNQTPDQYCVLNFDDRACFELAEREGCRAKVVPFSRTEELEFGAFAKAGNIVIKDESGKETVICGVDELKIPGSHNLENALAAAAVAYFGGIDPETIGKAMKEFAGVEHRIEAVCEKNGVRFVNDSKGTNTDAAIKAIEAMKENIILIAGGYDKGSTYDEFIDAFDGRVKELILMGVTAPKIRETAEARGFTSITMAENMEDCVAKAYAMAKPGDVVLLSPACASWDMYDNFEQRGDHFKECALKL